MKNNICKCGGTIIQQKNTKQTAPNEYLLEDFFVCQKCKIMTRKIVATIDKNTPETLALLAKQKTEKPQPKPVKDFSESERGDIDVNNLF